MIFSRFICVVACDRIYFLLKAERYSIVCIYHTLFIHQWTLGLLLPLQINSLPPFPFGILVMRILALLIMYHKSLGLFSFFFICFCFCTSKSMISNDLSSSLLVLFSAESNLLQKPSNEFFISVIVFFRSRVCSVIFYSLIYFLESLFPG